MKEYNMSATVSRRVLRGPRFIFVCCSVGLIGTSAYAKEFTLPDNLVQKTSVPPTELFDADLKILSRRLGAAFIAEGRAFSISKGKPVPTLSTKLSPEDAVREVADYFDYETMRQGNIYLLTKRYTDPEDLPDVSPEECQFGLKALTKILTPFNPRYPPETFAGAPMAKIASLLDMDRLEKLGKDGLPVSELTPTQHAEAWRLALKFYLQEHADRIEEASANSENRNPADPVFRWQTIKNIYAFGYDTRSVHLNKMLFIPVSDPNRIRVSPNGTTIQTTRTNNRTGAIVVTADPTDPAALSDAAKMLLDSPNQPTDVFSLSETVKALNKRAVKPLVCQVDEMYATKHVTLVGTDKLSADVLLRSLAAVYGLRLMHHEDGSFVLTHLQIHYGTASQISSNDEIGVVAWRRICT